MKVYMQKGEKQLYYSLPGKRYRFLVFMRDLICGVGTAILAYLFLDYFEVADGKFGIIIPSVGLVFWLMLAMYNQIIFRLTRYVITNKRIIIKKGLIHRRMTTIKIKNILDTKVRQTVQQLAMGCGTIYLFTANDSQNIEESFEDRTPSIENIDGPFQVHRILIEAMEEVREEDN